MNEIKIGEKSYQIIDSRINITLADSFLKNKIGSASGEAKLYVGSESEKNYRFFENMKEMKCFFKRSDFINFLNVAKQEFEDPQQDYRNKSSMPNLYKELKREVGLIKDDILHFNLNRVYVKHRGIYLKSQSDYYELMRKCGLPNISYLSILKLEDSKNDIFYYFKIFIDYRLGTKGYISIEEKKQIEKINSSKKTKTQKERIINARIGQGAYRNNLLKECQFCPITLVDDERLLIASHIKPWVNSNDKEKVDPKNGFILTPTFDKLFDRGFISFNVDKTLCVSPWLSKLNQEYLGIYDGMKVEKLPLDKKREEYLAYHREKIFLT